MHLPLLYLDANSANMLLSALAGGIAGAVVVVRVFFGRIADKFRRTKPLTADETATSVERSAR